MKTAIGLDGLPIEVSFDAPVRTIDGTHYLLTDQEKLEISSAATEAIAQIPNKLIKAQIAALEAQQTPRRIREAIKGTDNGWLSTLNNQIAALRAQLT